MNYVVGLLFAQTELGLHVALVRKARPEWQAGKLNGVGGKVEVGETPLAAMQREWAEETGTGSPVWRQFAELHWRHTTVTFFTGERGATAYPLFRTDTDEKVDWYALDDVRSQGIIPNLRWLIPLALDKDRPSAVVVDPS